MSLEEKNQILYTALADVCKVIREHCVDMDWYLEDPRRMQILSGGVLRDPEGQEFMAYFIQKAVEKLEKESL